MDYKNRRYSIEAYNFEWTKQFKNEAELLEACLKGNFESINHIGSTSVPGLAGKPTIDILVVVKDILQVDSFQSKLEDVGYESVGAYVSKDSRLFAKQSNNTRLVNLHFFPSGHKHISEMIKLRDYFRANPDVINEYGNLKFDLVGKFPNDYASYRKEKDAWMNALKEKLEF